MSDSVRAALAEVGALPRTQWRARLEARFGGDHALVEQALWWLHADAARDDEDDLPARWAEERYRLELRLGRGATATVWQAYDEKLERRVALKIFGAGAASSAVEEALAEARIACDVVSDHVVRVLDVHDDDTAPFIVMELVGEHDVDRDELVAASSAAMCRPTSVAEALRWVRDAAHGVHDAHLRNVFHRDLKPHNVLVAPISRRARVADFGLAISADSVGAMSLVRSSASGAVRIAGTPAYMAPEQARGLPIDLDPREPAQRERLVKLDVWGLGAFLYELLAGHPPWRSDSAARRGRSPLPPTAWRCRTVRPGANVSRAACGACSRGRSPSTPPLATARPRRSRPRPTRSSSIVRLPSIDRG